MVEVRVIKKMRCRDVGTTFEAYECDVATLVDQGYVVRCDAPEPVCEEPAPVVEEAEPEPVAEELESDGLPKPKKKRLIRKKRKLEADTNANE